MTVLILILLAAVCALIVWQTMACWLSGGYIADFRGTCRGAGLIWRWL